MKNIQIPYSFALPIVPIIGASGLPSHLDRGNFMEQEIWKDIKGYEGLYKISSYGRVQSIKTEKHISVHKMKTGYFGIRLWKENKTKYFTIHRLLAIHFIPNPENKREVNHIDSNKANFALTNLEWATPSENMKHAFDSGHVKNNYQKGFNHKQCKLTPSNVRDILSMRKDGKKLREIAEKFNISNRHASGIVRGITYGEIFAEQ